jgi:outer membrane protein
MISTQRASATPIRRGIVGTQGRSIARMGVRILPAIAFALVAAVGTADAQTTLKVGVVNFGKLLEAAPQSQTVTDKLKTEFASRQNEIIKMRTDLQTRQDRFTKDQAVMGEEERLNLERQIRDGQRDLQRTENEYVEDLNVRRNEEVNKLQRDIVQRVQAYASAQKFDLVVADAVYFSSTIDITADVLKILQTDGPRPSGAAAPPR